MSGSGIRDHALRIMAGGRPNRNAYLPSAALLKIQFVSNGPPSQGRRSHAAPARLKPPSRAVRTAGSGKVRRYKAFKSHILTKKSPKRKRNLRRSGLIATNGEQKRIKRLIQAA